MRTADYSRARIQQTSHSFIMPSYCIIHCTSEPMGLPSSCHLIKIAFSMGLQTFSKICNFTNY